MWAGHQGQTLKLEKLGHLFYVFGTSYTNFQQFPIKWGFGRNFRTKISTFIVVKSGNLCLRIPLEAPVYWKFLRIGIQRAKDMRKDGLIFQV